MNTHLQPTSDAESLGALLRRARHAKGCTVKELADRSGVAKSQISKLAHDQVRKANPAHLAALAGPLDLTVYELYAAAGYTTPSTIANLSGELEAKLVALPPDALARLEQFLESLDADHFDIDHAIN